MTDYTPPDVHRVRTRTTSTQERTVRLGYVDRHGVYRFPNGVTVTADGDAMAPHDGKVSSNVLVYTDASMHPNDQHAAAWPHGARHTVDAEYQGLYDADPDAFDADPSAVFAAVDGA
ncbi:hypothetical protein [Gordonia polyisoprenivorans]|uniref:hypothetical protein n=1 Tax=Gordonia polyisoprenivorans TaxID=84595 RepID=UPI00037FB09A|nr:hypothetical protein [Gordonia polyisoprenivorans]